MKLSRCRKCGCMKGTLENLRASLPLLKLKDAKELLRHVNEWLGQLEPLEYPCLGCRYCIPPEAMTRLTGKYPALASATLSGCGMTVNNDSWPPVEGEYTVLDASAPVAVSTLSSVKLGEKLAGLRPEGLCIVGKTETENIGIDKIVKNVTSNPAITSLILAGKDTEGHQSGRTLLALWENGVDENMRVIGSNGRRPILRNVTRSDVEKFRKQIHMENQIGCENTRTLARKIREMSRKTAAAGASACGCHGDCGAPAVSVSMPSLSAANGGPPEVPVITAKKHRKSSVKLDSAGYFVILPSERDKSILVEHYSYDNKLLRKIRGKNSRDIYFTIINNKWVTELSHAAYLGKELARAELSIREGFKFVQDGA